MAEYVLVDAPAWDTVKAAQNGDGTGTYWANSFLPFWGRFCALVDYICPGASPPLGTYTLKRTFTGWQSSTWTINEEGWAETNLATAIYTGIALDLPHNSKLTEVAVAVQGLGNKPTTMPTFVLQMRSTLTEGVWSNIPSSGASSTAANNTEWQAFHRIVKTGLDITIDRETKEYRLLLTNGVTGSSGMLAFNAQCSAESGGIFPS